ncbi:MAG: type II toxin-antitoxin system HicA family toxin [Chloroflexi bacterium]|nr:type II toxin-antitoxin system HicA family toxin [Chloroflexota bacterium]
MSKLPDVSSRECINALLKAGFVVARQRGSHIILYREDPYAKTIVPQRREISRGTLRRILRDAGVTVDEFIELL